jgi:carbamoyl-phosphate synthase small subunit
MGHQLLARALGCATYKLKFGHHGINHPVKDIASGRVLVTSQNHGFAVCESDLSSNNLFVSHKSLNDDCVEGFLSEKLRLMSLQFHPEARPGPSDAGSLFDSFIRGFVQ